MEQELTEPCASIAFMTNLVYDRGVALEYDLIHDRLEDAERRLADLEDMMPQVYGLTDLTTPEERADLVRALGKVRGYIQEGDAVMGQGAADEFNASFRATMWNIIVRCREMVREEPWMRPREVVEHGSYVIFTNLDTGETKQYFNINPPDSEEVARAAMFIKPYLEERWTKNLKLEIVPAGKLPPGEPSKEGPESWLYPKTYGDWLNLGIDIKEKDPSTQTGVNKALSVIIGQDEGDVDAAKRWLLEKAGELGIR